MDLLTNTKIRTKLMLLTGIMGLLIAVSAAFGVKMSSDINEEYQKIYNEDAYAATLATQTGKYFSEARNELTRYLTRVDLSARQQSLGSMQEFDKKLDGVLAELGARATSADGKKLMEDLQSDLRNYRQQREALIKVQPAPGAPTETFAEAKAVHASGDALSQDFDKIAAMATETAAANIKNIDEEIDRVVFTAAIIAVIVWLAAIFVGLRLSNNIGNRMERMAQAAAVIGNGDLSQAMTSDSHDEIGQAVENFEQMRQHLNSSMSSIHAAAEQVAAGSRNVSEASVSLSQGAAEQASSVEELSASISEISSQTASNAENAEKANALTIQASQQAQVGDADMKEMLVAMEDINTSSANISKIIKVIDEIAFQTNILALNAAVEAARAGQHGKGFAVVAEEVRNLAARSAKAAKETTELIEDSIAKVESGRAIADKTAESLQIIMNDVTEVADIVSAIAKASSEQKLALEQIDQGVLQVSQVVQANSATSAEAASASEQLNAQAARLHETARGFRLAENAGMPEVYSVSAVKTAGYPVAPAPVASTAPAPTLRSHNDENGFGKY